MPTATIKRPATAPDHASPLGANRARQNPPPAWRRRSPRPQASVMSSRRSWERKAGSAVTSGAWTAVRMAAPGAGGGGGDPPRHHQGAGARPRPRRPAGGERAAPDPAAGLAPALAAAPGLGHELAAELGAKGGVGRHLRRLDGGQDGRQP